MKAMTTEQIEKIFRHLYEQGAEQFFSANQMHNLEQAIKQHRDGTKLFSFEQGEVTIKMIEDAIAHNIALQKEKAKKAKAAEKKANKSKEDNAMKANQPKEDVIVIIEDGFDSNTNNVHKEDNNMTNQACQKCSGTGKYHTPLKDGSIGKCFACKGTGTTKVDPMTEAQIKFIRDLFKQVVDKMSKEKADNLVRIMKAHIAGEEIQSKRWASAAIDQLKAIKTNNRNINNNA